MHLSRIKNGAFREDGEGKASERTLALVYSTVLESPLPTFAQSEEGRSRPLYHGGTTARFPFF